MKVHAVHKRIQEFLKQQVLPGITITDDVNEANYIITGKYSEENYNESLKGIIIPWTGHNGINLDDLRQRKIDLYVTPTRSKYVALKAVTLTLSLLGKTVHYHNLLKQGNWAERNSTSRLPWESILHKRIGLFGYGRIGQLIHQQLSGFDGEFYTINRGKKHDNIHVVEDLEELVKTTDILIISVPLNTTTEGIISKNVLELMTDKYIVNVGRGKVINQEDLYNALKNKTLKGFASDVWYNYPREKEICFPSDFPIYEFDNVVLSNHSGGYTETTNQEVNEDLVKTLIKLQQHDFSDKLDVKNLL